VSFSIYLDNAGLWRLVHLLRGFQKLKGWHVQFNVVDSKTLLAAQEMPEQYKDLVVRVARKQENIIISQKREHSRKPDGSEKVDY
jgi:N6-adenosine-specific RNA methylase IME4